MINEKKKKGKKKKELVEEDTIYTKTNMKIIDRNHSKKNLSFVGFLKYDCLRLFKLHICKIPLRQRHAACFWPAALLYAFENPLQFGSCFLSVCERLKETSCFFYKVFSCYGNLK